MIGRRDAISAVAVAASGGGAVEAARAAPAPAMTEALVVLVSLRVRPDCVEEFFGLLTPVLDAMRHEASFINAVLHRDAADPATFILYETWADREDLIQVQMRRDYRQAYEARLPALLAAPREARILQRLRADFTFFAP